MNKLSPVWEDVAMAAPRLWFPALAFLIVAAAAIPVEARQGQGPRPPQFKSPEVREDRSVALRVFAPDAKTVRVSAGDMPAPNPRGSAFDLKKSAEGVWEVVFGPLPPGSYRYRFQVDGLAVVDPRNPSVSESNADAWSLVVVPGSPVSDLKDVPHGAVAEVVYRSKSLDRFRRMHVYTPPGYENNSEKYPVFYLLHGASDSDDSWSTIGKAGLVLDNLIAVGKAKPMIVVMPAGHTGAFGFGPGNAFQNQMAEFVKDFVGDVRPHVEKTYRVRTGRADRAIAGLSMGGMQTLDVAVGDLDDYGYVGVFSSGVFGIDRPAQQGAGPSWEERNRKTLDDADLKKGLKLFWFATGKDDFLLETTRATVKMLESHDFKVTYLETDGGHTWIKWREHYLPEFAQLLFRDDAPAAAAAPKPAPAKTATLAGRWSAEFDTQIGKQKYVFTFKTEKDAILGSASAVIGDDKHESKIVEGRIEGTKVRFVEELKFGENDLRIAYSGELVGDELRLDRKVGDFAEETLVAKRLPEDKPKADRPATKGRRPGPQGPPPKVTLGSAPAGFDRKRPDAPAGKVETVEYDSKTVGIKRRLVIYTPPGFDKNRKYPVLYLLHGIGDTEKGWTRERAATVLDNLYADKLAEPMIVVMPYGRASATPVPANIFDRGEFETYGNFENELLKDVIPFVESHYPVKSDRESRALAGLSMGGGQSLNIGLAHPEAFAWVGGFSSAPNTKPAKEVVADPAKLKDVKLVWISCGDRDGLMGVSRDFHEALEGMKVPHVFEVESGGHDFNVWRNDLFHFGRKLFR